jgi:hypothetical protein
MNKLVLLAPLALVAACSQSEPAPEATAGAQSAGLAVDGKPAVGTFEITASDGRRFTQVVASDGTYTSTTGDTTIKGTWSAPGPGRFCETEEGAAEAVCYDEVITPEGAWTASNPADPSATYTIKRVE